MTSTFTTEFRYISCGAQATWNAVIR